MHKQFVDYSLKPGVIPDEQFGFLPKRSTVLQLLSVFIDIHCAMDEGRIVHACFLDISKGFDRVDHGLLLDRLRGIRVEGTEQSWFASFLKNRTIFTCVNGIPAKIQPISSGVPLGSVLGQNFFVLFPRRTK